MGSLLSKKVINYRYCRCDNISIATYRCRMFVRKDFCYSSKMSDTKIDNDILYDEFCKAIFKQFKKYCEYSFAQCTYNGITTWIGCGKCITENVKPYFTYHPKGWQDPDFDTRNIDDYEYIKL
jgi:hypothetical protein